MWAQLSSDFLRMRDPGKTMATTTVITTLQTTILTNSDDENDVLVAQAGALAVSTGFAIDFSSNASAAITVAGSVGSAKESAIRISGPSSTGTGNVYLNIAETGVVTGTLETPDAAIEVRAGSSIVTNAGAVGGSMGFSFLAGTVSFHNTGTILTQGNAIGIEAASGTNTIFNSGTIAVSSGPSISGSDGGIDKVTNTGTISGYIQLRNGSDVFSNLGGTINGAIDLGSGDDTASNTGTINGDVILGSGLNKLTTSGAIAGAVTGGTSADTLSNTGLIVGAIDLSNGSNVLFNSGTIIGNAVLGSGDDTVTNTGSLTGTFSLGGGSDTFLGGVFEDRVLGNAGDDSVHLRGGDDTFLAEDSDGNDIVRGSDGTDTYDASAATSAMTIDLDDGIAKGAGTDRIFGFENAVGSASAGDTLLGSALANELSGLGGGDVLRGFAGNDILDGGAGTDRLVGGLGKDVLTGGTEADVFDFDSAAETGRTAATRDIITDFESGIDKIDLATIDARTTVGGNQKFAFIGAGAFTGVAGQLHYTAIASGLLVEGDTNGDRKADFSIVLLDATSLLSTDFAL